jgi:hypothetical protein
MTAVVEHAPDAQATPAVERHRRWSRWSTAALVVGLVVTGLVWSLLLWAPASVELRAGQTAFGGRAEVVSLADYGPRGTHVVDYRHGATVDVTVPIHNGGPLPVTVTSVGTGAGVLPLLEVRDVTGVPLELGPGETGEVALRGVLGNCAYYHEREVQVVEALVVRADVLGRSTTRSVLLDSPVVVHSPMIVGCPDRKLDRQANDRVDAL